MVLEQFSLKGKEYSIQLATKDLVFAHVEEILAMCRLIPQEIYSVDSVMEEKKVDRIKYGKWEHSLLVFDGAKPVAVLLAYERKAEANDMYPINQIFIGDLAVHQDYQGRGIARHLMNFFFQRNLELGYQYLEGEVVFGLQTNSADWNLKVRSFYESLGFVKTGEKLYPDHIENIYRLKF